MPNKTQIFISIFLSIFALQGFAAELERRQAKRIHDRLTGTPPTNTVLTAMETLIFNNVGGTGDIDAANMAINNKAFYNITLKNFATPWTNEEQTIFAPLNDYSATVIGMVRDDIDFREILYGDIIYRGNNSPAYDNNNNDHYETLEASGYEAGNLADENILIADTQSNVTGLVASATAGIFTTRQGARAYYYLGTNRAMFRFTLINHLCTDLEPLNDITRIPNRIRQDVSRSPGGDSRLFLNGCVGCHAGMDGLAGAYAHYELNFMEDIDGNVTENTATLNYTPNAVHPKHLINSDNFKPGYVTTDDSWINYWRNGKNSRLGWGLTNPNYTPVLDGKGNAIGNGAKTMGMELASSTAFASCQVEKVFKSVCLRDPNDAGDPNDILSDRAQLNTNLSNSIANNFITNGYNLKTVFAETAAFCKGN